MTTDTVGGVWNYSVQFAQQLREFGIEVVLATMGHPLRRDQRAEISHLFNVALLESNYKLEWMDNPWNDIKQAGPWLLHLEEKFRPDVVHLNQFCFGTLPWKAPVVVVGHSCIRSWWNACRPDQPVDKKFHQYSEVVRAGLEAASCVVAPTKAMMRELLRCYQAKFRSYAVIPNGRSIRPRPDMAKEALIFCAGRIWDEAKNITSILRIADKLSWPVYVAGDGRGMSLPNTPNFHYLGLLSSLETETWMHRASIYVSPARYEPFALAVLEAALAKCALVLGDIDSLKENWQDAALFVHPEKTDHLLSAIQNFIEDRERLQDYAIRANEKAMLLTPQRMAFQYIRIYEALLRNGATETYRSSAQSNAIPGGI